MAKFIVTNNNDSGIGSLRQAIIEANKLEGADTVEVSGNITLSSAINITDSVSILNVGKTIITQAGNDRLFNINDGDVDNLSKVNFVGIRMTGGNTGRSGGAIFSQEDLGLFRSNLFGNTAGDRGGAVYVEGGNLRVNRTNIFNNQARTGGGVALFDSQANLVNSKISGNTATDGGGGISSSYGSQLELFKSEISGNTANDGGGISAYYYSSAKLVNTTVSGNTAQLGGGIASTYYSQVEIVRSIISGNDANISGGINIANSALKATDSEVSGNSANDIGGVSISYYSTAEITNSNISGNTAKNDAGGINVTYSSSLNLDKSIVANNIAGQFAGGINVHLDSQLKVFDTAIVDNTNGGIQSYDGSTVTLISSPVTNNSLSNISGYGITEITTQIIEAEDITNLAGYRLESNSLASGGKLLSLVGESQNEVGTAKFDFTGATGNYTVKIGTYDENDGAATIQLAQQGNVVGSVILDENSGSNAIANDTKVTKVVAANISINQGDSFTLTGFEDGNEHARIDFIEFQAVNKDGEGAISNPVDTTPTPTPTPAANSIRWEAEAADSLTGYRTENIAGASAGTVLSLLGEAFGETGSASFTVGDAGTYDILLATYDENDGAASFNVELNGSRIGDTLVLNNDLGSNLANAQTAVSDIIAFGVSLEAGDVLTVNGFEQDSEHARLDYVELLATEEGTF